MKSVIVCLLLCVMQGAMAQSRKEFKARIRNGYTTASGWKIKKGDTIQIGKGSRENGSFAFIYSAPQDSAMLYLRYGEYASPQLLRYRDRPFGTVRLPAKRAGRMARVKGLIFTGGKKDEYKVIAVAGMKTMTPYWIEIDSALSVGEIIPPKGLGL
ncbi:hypothetical protein F0L74_13845 [Chitinophaga agrisoli]|uniref:Uncharacterized protein n=1 Tax=Chitinophaga agrisoli TaxID=2607653 RepID=A0A5B2VZT6_9BACT|nr:hypothetical protein [Chitinophaga agrisoli]KAA2243569.1 hypothetical protein F0L74_13845 [Chitinophaga agrisoli]